MPTLVSVLLAGGEGKRLRPLSSSNRPKQFLKLIQDVEDTLLQASVRRTLMVADASNIITVASAKYKNLIRDQLASVDTDLTKNVILEPLGRNTTAAITSAAIYAANHYDDPLLWVVPSDHTVVKAQLLQAAIKKSLNAARLGKIVVFGINPTRADSNYDYILGGDALRNHDYMHSVRMFVDKPSGDHLKWMHKQKNCWWNSGMFVLSTNTLFSQLKQKNLITLETVVKAYKNGRRTKHGFVFNKDYYSSINPNPINKFIMQTNRQLVTYPVDIGWSDVGSWQSLWELSQKEGEGKPLDNFLEKIAKAA